MCEYNRKEKKPPNSFSIHICYFLSSSIFSVYYSCPCGPTLSVTMMLLSHLPPFNVGHVTHTSSFVTKEFSVEVSVGDTIISDLIY